MPFLLGIFIKVTAYKQIVLEINEHQYQLARKWRIPSWTYETTKSNTVETEAETKEQQPVTETRYFARITLDRYDKQALSKKFQPLLSKDVVINGEIKSFTPKTTDETPQPQTHYYFLLHDIRVKATKAE